MFLTTGALVLSRKISDKRAKDKQAKEQALGQNRGIHPKSTNNLPTIPSEEAYQPPNNVPDNASDLSNHLRDIHIQPPSNSNSAIRVSTEYSAHSPRPSSDYGSTAELSPRGAPPPYSPTRASSSRTASIAESSLLQPDSAISHGTFSSDNTLCNSTYSDTLSSPSHSNTLHSTSPSNALTPTATTSSHSTSTTTTSTAAEDSSLRIRTCGTDLKTGFPYAPELFDLRVPPSLWETFTAQIISTTKLSTKDHATIISAATATALTGALLTSVYVGRSLNHSLREKIVKSGLENMSDGGLGDVLKTWNEREFAKLGLFVHLELSAKAMRSVGGRTPTMGMHPLLYSSREERERKAEDRKFCLVVSRLDGEGVPREALREVEEEMQGGEVGREVGEEEEVVDERRDKAVEVPNPENVIYEVPELPGDEGRFPVELPAGISLGYGSSKFEIGCAELDGTPVTAASKDFDPDRKEKIFDEDENANLMPAPLMVTAETHAALHKEIT
ncbi:hypothetical protein PRZ48_001140 [Zasmidium cellare]|uniref:Uncharacterized protein n=1 Tax=Zasmidium cellare TaxID=395010 RepID=A0ABR0F289_ZASCE|nr:hypothetical protein PRZ48_001140 [Zasmidium cellare]